MADETREMLCRFFPELSRFLPLLEKEGGTGAVLLISEDASSTLNALALAKLLSTDPLQITCTDISEEHWAQQTDVIHETGQQMEFGSAQLPERLCLAVLGLDKAPEWLTYRLKSLLENSARPFTCVASATNGDAIPDFLSSHFYKCKAAGRDRRPWRKPKS